MATNIPFTGNFRVTCEYKRPGSWFAGYHTGIDLVGVSSKAVYATCNGVVYKTGFDSAYGNYVVIKAEDNKYHWLCHLANISVSKGQKVTRTSKVGIMGSTGNVTGPHTHFEIRTSTNQYGDTIDPAEYMGVPNKVGLYNSSNYQLSSTQVQQTPTPTVEYYPTCTSDTNSFVDGLKSIGVDSSLANRKTIAIKNGINDYKGTASQNTSLLDKLKKGTLIK